MLRSPIQRLLALGTVVAVAAAGLSTAPAASGATTAVQTREFDLGDMDLGGGGTFEQFDPALGTLRSARITADVDMEFDVCLTNLSLESNTIPAGLASGEAPISFAGDIVAETYGEMVVPGVTLSANEGGDPCAEWLETGVEPTTDDSVLYSGTAADDFARTITKRSILDLYTGKGTVPFSFTSSSQSNLGQPSEWTIIFLAHGTGETSIVYDYENPGPTPKAQPTLRTEATDRDVVLPVDARGTTSPVTLRDRITLKGFRAGGDAKGRATLYGPAPSLSRGMCTPAMEVGTVRFKPRNGTFRTPGIKVDRPGYYSWVASVSGDSRNEPVSHGCGLKAETSLVHRPDIGPVIIDTGATRTQTASMLRGARLRIGGLGINAPVLTVGASNGRLNVPGNTHKVGWYRRTARPGDAIGTTLVAGHVSDHHDNPGALWRLKSARPGQVVTVGGHRYKVTSKFSQPRSRRLPGSIFRTTGPSRLALVSCTAKVTYPDGSFHYTKNLVVVAKRVR